MLSVAVAAVPSMMEEKALVMEKALARSTRKVSADRSLLPYPPIVVEVPIGRFRRPCSLSMPPSLHCVPTLWDVAYMASALRGGLPKSGQKEGPLR